MSNQANIRKAARAIIEKKLSFDDVKMANSAQNPADKLSDGEIFQALNLAEKAKLKRKWRKIGFVLSIFMAPFAFFGSLERAHLVSGFNDASLGIFLTLCAIYFYWSYKNTS